MNKDFNGKALNVPLRQRNSVKSDWKNEEKLTENEQMAKLHWEKKSARIAKQRAYIDSNRLRLV